MYVIRERLFRLGEDSDITDQAGQPVLVGTAYGVWKEHQLDKQVWQVIDERTNAPAQAVP